jgi:hypothetical protein
MRRVVVAPDPDVDLDRLAERCRYIGSPEHKSSPSFAGPPKLRQADATKCDPALKDSAELLTQWLRSAVRAGQIGAWQGQFPKYAWYRVEGQCYEARLTNPGNGDYKGYALTDAECPDGI